LAEGETAHPANYRSCRHAKVEMRKEKPQVTPKNTAGRVFVSNFIKPSVSFAAALQGHKDKKHTNRKRQVQLKGIPYLQTPNNSNTKQQETGQLVLAPRVKVILWTT
jgi:hypothetical protein